jgi:PHD/YefM family antitoxin component YafN of YafNO toxin-antitoxin module
MSKYLTIAQARKEFLNLPDELINEPVIITKHGKPVMVTFSYEQIESLVETLEILNDREIAPLLDEAIQQDQTGEKINWEEAKSQLGW